MLFVYNFDVGALCSLFIISMLVYYANIHIVLIISRSVANITLHPKRYMEGWLGI